MTKPMPQDYLIASLVLLCGIVACILIWMDQPSITEAVSLGSAFALGLVSTLAAGRVAAIAGVGAASLAIVFALFLKVPDWNIFHLLIVVGVVGAVAVIYALLRPGPRA